MSDVMTQCVPVATGALTPDQRVNYLFGLVLGVDEFQQEDLYFRERDERASRTLHGYGTAVGLDVTAERPEAAPNDVEVKITRGILVDKPGRHVTIPTAQCARVGAWIAAQEEAAAADEAASPLEEHMGPSGDVTLYVVAEYDTCADGLVPLPGKPCGSDDEVTAPSRIRDSWQLGFRYTPPDMAHWDGVRALADILIHVDLDEMSPMESDEELLAEHIRALVPGSPAPATPLPPRPLLPRLDARAALDRLLTIWVTEVRPTLTPDLIAPEGDPAVLLSTITVVPAQPFATDAPAIVEFGEPDDEGRPYLAPTQLIQELVLMGGSTTFIGGGTGSPIEAEALIKLATFTQFEQSTEDGSVHLPVLWFHLDEQVTMPETVMVSRDTEQPVPFDVSPRDFPRNTFFVTPQRSTNGSTRLRPDELLELHLDLTTVSVELDDRSSVSMLDWLEDAQVDALGREGDILPLHHTMMIPDEVAPPEPSPPRPVRKLASAQGVFVDGEVPGIELWWHVDKNPMVDEERVDELSREAVRVFAEVEPQMPTPTELDFEIIPGPHNVFRLMLTDWEKVSFSPYLRVLINLEGVFLGQAGVNLIEYGDQLGVTWEDAQEDDRVLTVWVRMFDFGQDR